MRVPIPAADLNAFLFYSRLLTLSYQAILVPMRHLEHWEEMEKLGSEKQFKCLVFCSIGILELHSVHMF